MSHYLDLDTWPRRDHFRFFRHYEEPFFNLCAPVDVTALRTLCRTDRSCSLTLAYHWLVLRAVNAVAPFRLRLRGERVWVHDRINLGTTLLLEDERFTFVYFEDDDDFAAFQASARATMDAVRKQGGPLIDRDETDDLIHCSVMPWVAFTGLRHARRHAPDDAVPKIVFGKIHASADRYLMPVSVSAHHALMDGLHVGRFFEHFEAGLRAPSAALGRGSV